METTGDPLQLLLALYFVLVWFAFGYRREPLSNSTIALTSFGGFAVASTLVHEASVFFTLPCTLIITLWRKSKFAFAALIGHALGAGLTLAAVLWTTERPDAVSSLPLIHIGSENAPYEVEVSDLLRNFSSMLATQIHRLFGQGLHGYFAWSSNLTGTLLLPIFLIYLFILAYGANGPGNRFRIAILLLITAAAPASLASDISIRVVGYLACFFALPAMLLYCTVDHTFRSGSSFLFPVFAVLIFFSVPLYIIAHDWGRFLSYSLFCSFVLCSINLQTSKIRLRSDSILAISPLVGAGLIIAGITATPLLNIYRFAGLKAADPLFVAASATIAVALLLKELAATYPSSAAVHES